MKKIKFFRKFSELSTSDFLRLSISFFLTGILFVFFEIYFSIPDETHFFEAISGVFMAFAIVTFPFINREQINKLGTYLLKFCVYVILLLFTIGIVTNFISLSQKGVVVPLLGVVSAILLFLTLNFTIKPLITIVFFVSKKIKQVSKDKGDSKIETIFKNTFANIAIITSFIISMLTIIKSVIEIMSK